MFPFLSPLWLLLPLVVPIVNNCVLEAHVSRIGQMLTGALLYIPW